MAISDTNQQKTTKLSFSQKYGLRFYSFLIAQSVTLSLLFCTGSSPLALSFISFYNIIGNYLPIKAKDDRYLSKIQNANNFLLGPLIVSCLSTPLIIYLAWKNYDALVQDSFLQNVNLIFVFAFLISGSIDAAHQLLHRTEPICKFFCYLNLFFFQFTIYPTEHLYLHHKKVGTPEDPITSPKNRSLYRYYINALVSCYKFNFNYSKKIFVFNVGSTILYNILLISFAMKEGNGLSKALFFSALSYVTLFIMEAIEYIEHYGLVYRADEKAKPVNQICSWNTSQNQLLNWFVFRFQRHSDHHMNAYKLYPTLDLTDKMPQFPFDFISGLIMSLIPPLWYKLINPLSQQVVQGKQISKQHRQLVKKSFNFLQIILTVMFPLRLIEYLVL